MSVWDDDIDALSSTMYSVENREPSSYAISDRIEDYVRKMLCCIVNANRFC